VILFDDLVAREVLDFARREARKMLVGKTGYGPSCKQEEINALMVQLAKAGRRVVRLKGGDPFVFGRGGEEAQALRAAGIPFEIVPGVTSAFAAPALAGIPVTRRGVSSAVVVVSGHDDRAFARVVESLPPRGVTLVVLMAGGRAAGLGGRLRQRGWPADLPAAIVTNASAPDQQVWRGTLAELCESVPADGPATIIVGEVVALSGAIDRPASECGGSYVSGA
jgi:uroporphyrin-III C-methyltransferase/precorrin-2 dehydrogenase/sirohydrochlorin ferrochelatase